MLSKSKRFPKKCFSFKFKTFSFPSCSFFSPLTYHLCKLSAYTLLSNLVQVFEFGFLVGFFFFFFFLGAAFLGVLVGVFFASTISVLAYLFQAVKVLLSHIFPNFSLHKTRLSSFSKYYNRSFEIMGDSCTFLMCGSFCTTAQSLFALNTTLLKIL